MDNTKIRDMLMDIKTLQRVNGTAWSSGSRS